MTWLAAFIARSALMQSPLGGFLKAVPAWAWKALIIAAVLLAGFLWHNHAAAKHDRAVIAAEDQRLAAKALKLKQQVDDLNVKIATYIRSRTDEENRRIASTADALRLSGPGKAICRASIPAAVSGPQPASGNGNATGPQVPAGDLAAVPWGWLVDRAEEHDLNRQEALAWRQWYAKMLANWPK